MKRMIACGLMIFLSGSIAFGFPGVMTAYWQDQFQVGNAETGPMATGLFGLKNFGMIFGLIFTAYGLVGGIAGPALAGFILEKTGGNYGIVFTYLGVFALLGMGLITRIRVRE